MPVKEESIRRSLEAKLKRALDVGGAALAVVASAPLMAATAAVIRVTLGKPVLFRQERPGLNGRPFAFLKFRTMRDALGPNGEQLPDTDRLPPIGAFIRSTSLDELPQLFNVLRGEMSLVGPRPLLVEYLGRYSKRQARRHEVKPGITGLAQVRGRNALSWEEKFELDVWYVDNWSLALDARILLETASTVLRRRGVSSQNHPTMPHFQGSLSPTATPAP